jgi:hypothetical protein
MSGEYVAKRVCALCERELESLSGGLPVLLTWRTPRDVQWG